MIAIVMLISVSSAGLILFNYYGHKLPPEPEELKTNASSLADEQINDPCENFTGIEKAKCYLDRDDLNASIETCENMSSEERNMCYQGMALNTIKKDVSNLNASIGLCDDMSEGKFYCYTYLSSIAVKSDIDTGIFLCNLTSPPYVCWGTIGRVIGYAGANESLELCRKINDAVCYASAGAVIARNDSESALFLCGKCVNDTNTPCGECYSNAAKEIAPYDAKKAIDTCSEGANAANKYHYSFSSSCHINAAEAAGSSNGSAAFEICGNLTGLDKAACYFEIVGVSDNPEHIEKMCNYMIGIWGEDPTVMRYCRDYA